MKESEFSKYMKDKLKRAGYMVDRIETHSTSVGIPDIHVTGHGEEYWLELKSCPKMKFSGEHKEQYTIPWRPGQRAWALTYFVKTRCKCSLTVVRTQDSICFIPMDSAYSDNVVKRSKMTDFMPFISKQPVTLVYILRYMTTTFDWDCTTSARDNLARWVEEHLRMDVDYDPEALWYDDVDEAYSEVDFHRLRQDMFETLLWSLINSTTK